MKKKSRVILKAIEKKQSRLINIRMSEEDRAILIDKAERYANGNLSAFVKYAVRGFTPKASELKIVC